MEARKIQSLREALGLTQSELAKVLKVTRVSIAMWELGKTTPTAVNLARIEDYARKQGFDPMTLPAFCAKCAKTGFPGGLCRKHAEAQ